jgi:hypothetical protein
VSGVPEEMAEMLGAVITETVVVVVEVPFAFVAARV